MRWVWHAGGLSARELAARVWAEFSKDDVLGRSAQLSFYLLLALFPFMLFISSVLGLAFAGNEDLYNDLLSYLQTVMPHSAYELVRGTVQEITDRSSKGKLSFGLAATLWAASSGMDAIINGLNVAYDVSERRPWWKRRLVALNLTVLFTVMSGCALLVMLFGRQFGIFLARQYGYGDAFQDLWFVLQVVFPPVFMLLVFTLTYRFAPNIKAHGWQALLPGSLAALILWMAATTLFRVYLAHFDSYSKTYGSIGAVVVLMLWLYLSGVAILVGAEINSEIRKAAAQAGAPAAKQSLEAPSGDS